MEGTGSVDAGEPCRPLRILLVEDHEDSANLLARLLARLSHQVRVTGSVRTALEAAAEQPFDLVLSDIGLPDGTGFDLMRELRERHRLVGIALSGYGMESDVESSLRSGFAEHITKPLDFGQLIAAIHRVAAGLRA